MDLLLMSVFKMRDLRALSANRRKTLPRSLSKSWFNVTI